MLSRMARHYKLLRRRQLRHPYAKRLRVRVCKLRNHRCVFGLTSVRDRAVLAALAAVCTAVSTRAAACKYDSRGFAGAVAAAVAAAYSAAARAAAAYSAAAHSAARAAAIAAASDHNRDVCRRRRRCVLAVL